VGKAFGGSVVYRQAFSSFAAETAICEANNKTCGNRLVAGLGSQPVSAFIITGASRVVGWRIEFNSHAVATKSCQYQELTLSPFWMLTWQLFFTLSIL
jgi:hypothetical protein